MVFDCCMFFAEIELLKLRLSEGDSYIDKFIIVEGEKTFTGKPKPVYFNDIRHEFKQWEDKIIHVTSDFRPRAGEWNNEIYQREKIRAGLVAAGAKGDDICIISDIDEVPNYKAIDYTFKGTQSLLMRCFYYYFNCEQSLTIDTAKVMPWSYIEPRRIQECRGLVPDRVVEYGGWHFSFLGTPEKIRTKIEAYSHQDLNLPQYVDLNNIKDNIDNLKDIFNRSYNYKIVEIDNSFPAYLISHQEELKEFIKI